MKTAKEHYDQQLAAIYSWMSGGSEAATERNRDLFHRLEMESLPRGLAVVRVIRNEVAQGMVLIVAQKN